MSVKTKAQSRLKRRRRVRAKVSGTAERPRISVFEADLRGLAPKEQAAKAGELLAERAKAKGVERAVFDRGGYQFHGNVKAFAEGVREGGLAV